MWLTRITTRLAAASNVFVSRDVDNGYRLNRGDESIIDGDWARHVRTLESTVNDLLQRVR